MLLDIGTFVFSKDHELFVSFPEAERGFRAVTLESAAIRQPGSLDRFSVSLAGYVRDFGT